MTKNDGPSQTWVTQEAYDRLREERDQLAAELRTGEGRASRDGLDGDGHDAVGGPRGLEGRIRDLDDLLRRAVVGETPPDDGMVEDGMIVSIRLDGQNEVEKFLLGARELLSLDPTVELDVYSRTSPLGSAIFGKYPGETVTYQAPTGRTLRAVIVEAKPFAPSARQ